LILNNKRTCAPTLQEALEDFLLLRPIKDETKRAYRKNLTRTLADWMSLDCNSISKSMVATRHGLLSRGRDSGDGRAYANVTMRILRSVYNFACAYYEDENGNRLVIRNPVEVLSAIRAWNRVPRRTGTILGVVSDWLSSVLKTKNDSVRDCLLFLWLTGMRKSEATNLLWRDVDLVRKTVMARETKNGTDHTLPLSDFLYDLLSLRKERSKGKYVFPSVLPDAPIALGSSSYARIRSESGRPKFTPHDLRRSFLTVADALDFSLRMTKRLANHVNNDVTVGYMIMSPERLRKHTQAITDYMFDEEAQQTKEAVLAQIKREYTKNVLVDRLEAVTFGEAADAYIESLEVAAITKQSYQADLARVSHLREQSLTTISGAMIEKTYRSLSEVYSEDTVEDSFQRMRKVFEYGLETYRDANGGRLSKNPALDVIVFGGRKSFQHTSNTKKETLPESLSRWYVGLTDVSKTMSDYILFMLLTGLRRHEAAHIKWEDVNFEDRILTIKDLKLRSVVQLPITKHAYNLLRRRVLNRLQHGHNPFVFPGRGPVGDKRYVSVDNPQRAFSKIRNSTGIHCDSQTLRRTFFAQARALQLIDGPLDKDSHSKLGQGSFLRLESSMQRIEDALWVRLKAKDTPLTEQRNTKQFELERIQSGINKINRTDRTQLLLAFVMGLPLDEVAKLKWHQVDSENRIIAIRGEKQRLLPLPAGLPFPLPDKTSSPGSFVFPRPLTVLSAIETVNQELSEKISLTDTNEVFMFLLDQLEMRPLETGRSNLTFAEVEAQRPWYEQIFRYLIGTAQSTLTPVGRESD
jgi:integrase